jgi:hypothetical protein
VTLEIGCSSTILRVLVAANTLLTLSLAVLGGTPKKMILAALVISNSNLRLKEPINRRAPANLETFYKYNHIIRFIIKKL